VRHFDREFFMAGEAVSGLVAAGTLEVALGAVLGFPYALTVEGSVAAKRLLTLLHVNHPRRLRQLHLDLIIMGILLIAAGGAVPHLPLLASLAVGIGGWTNALMFVPLMVNENLQPTRPFRAVTLLSFLAVSSGWVAIAAITVSRL
jgi:hypothetical protein